MIVEFVGQSSRDDKNRAANTGRLLNCYRENAGQGGRTGFVLMPAPGMDNRITLPGVFMRNMITAGGVIYAVCGGKLFSVNGAMSSAELGFVTNSSETTLSSHDGYVTVAAGGNYYVWDGTTLSMPAAGAFSSFGAVDALGSYTILTEKGGKRFQWSALADATSLPGLNFASAEQRDDNIIRPVVVNGLLWLMGESSCEIWAGTGGSGASAFAWMSGGIHDVGLYSYGMVTKFAQGAFFVGSDRIAYITDGTQIRPVSTVAVATALVEGSLDRCLYFEARGHKFCAVIFRDRPAWVYDIATGEWFERSEGVRHGAWKAKAATQMNRKWYIGRDDGSLAELRDTSADTDEPMVREFVSRTLYREGERFRIKELEIFARKGWSSYAKATVSLSGDDGATWGKERSLSFGDLGDFGKRAILRALGLYRQVTVKVRVSDPNFIPVYCDNRIDIA